MAAITERARQLTNASGDHLVGRHRSIYNQFGDLDLEQLGHSSRQRPQGRWLARGLLEALYVGDTDCQFASVCQIASGRVPFVR